jgi:hypothetical protein
MAYLNPNFKTKKAAQEAIAAGTVVTWFSPGIPDTPHNNEVNVEGPHYPKPHTWGGTATIDGNVVTRLV